MSEPLSGAPIPGEAHSSENPSDVSDELDEDVDLLIQRGEF